MKVLIIAFGHPDNVLSLSKALSKKIDLTLLFVASGHRFQEGVLNIDMSKLSNGLCKDKSLINKIFPKEINKFVNKNFNLWLLKTPNRKILKDVFFRNLRLIFRTANSIKKEKFDVVHFNGVSGFIIYFYYLLKRIPKVWTIHDHKAHSGEENEKAERINKILSKWNFQHIQHYKYLRQSLIKYYNLNSKDVHQVYSGPFEIFKYFNEKKTLDISDYFLFFGRISKYKGVDYLIDAYSQLDEPKPKLIIAGEGKLWFDNLQLSKDKKIIFLNRYIESEELIWLIKNSRIVIAPYTDATHSAVIMTAYTFCKPVIASNIDGLCEVVTDNKTGLLVNPRDTKTLKVALKKVIDNPGIITGFSININNLLNNGKLSWAVNSEKTIQVYTEAIKKN